MKFLYTTILSLLFLTSCAGDDPTEDTTENNSENSTEETIVEDDALDEEVREALEGLELNGSDKWKVDASTDAGMRNVQNLVDNFDGVEVKQLGKDIKLQLKDITKSCDMKGEDHNQYHIVLAAMMKESKLLKKEKSTDPSKMQRYLDAYFAHFELGEIE